MFLLKNYIISSFVSSFILLTGAYASTADNYSQEYIQPSSADSSQESLEQLTNLTELFSEKFLAVSDSISSGIWEFFSTQCLEVHSIFEELKIESNKLISMLDQFDQEDAESMEQCTRIKDRHLTLLANLTLLLAKQAIESNHSFNKLIKEQFELITKSKPINPSELLKMQSLLKFSKQYNSLVRDVSQDLQELTLNFKSI